MRKSKKEYRFKDNPRERIFYETFMDKHFNDGRLIDFVSYIIHGTSSTLGNPPKKMVSEEEMGAFLSCIQWLGSPVGQGFLDDVKENIEEELK